MWHAVLRFYRRMNIGQSSICRYDGRELANRDAHDISSQTKWSALAHDTPEGECQVVWYKEDTEAEEDDEGHDDACPATLALRSARCHDGKSANAHMVALFSGSRFWHSLDAAAPFL